ncbi:MAG: outer membrane lipoprotein-sorting protein [Candidatus Marinimicrobia bacterium]|nr:outer membrane lipoprotein-sorting protein [Candidatus Neomarinimicrobiota bacterium]
MVWVIKNNFIPITIEYYDRENPELSLKPLVQHDIKAIDGIPTATKVAIYNQQEDSQTSIEILEV